ncbi:MAG: hypothetical protein GY930_05880 [bacterium]|nr:hypothetical protein [bacterium]
MKTPISNPRGSWWGAVVALLIQCLFGCGEPADGHHKGGAGLAWSLSSNPTVQVQITRPGIVNDPWLLHGMDRWSGEMGLQVRVLEAGESPSSGFARVIIGCAGDKAVDELLEHLGIQQRNTHWSIAGMTATHKSAWLVATFLDPLGGGYPVTLLCAQNEESLAPGLKRLQPGTFPMLRLYSEGFPVLETELNSLGKVRRDRWLDCRPWHRQPKGVVDRRRSRYKDWHIDSVGECVDVDLRAYADSVDGTWQVLGFWSGLERPNSPKLFAQDSAHQWRLADRPGGWAQVSLESKSVQALILPGGKGDGGAEAGRVYLEQHLGPAALPWLAEAAAIQASGIYWGIPLEQWCRHLACLIELPTPQKLISGEGLARTSPHLITPLRALLVQVISDQDPRQLKRLWVEGASINDWKPWFAAFGERLGGLTETQQGAQSPQSLEQWSTRRGVSMQGGFDLEAPGLASASHGARLRELRVAQASVAAYTLNLISAPHSPLVRSRPLRDDPRMGDVRSETLLLASAAMARRAGISVAMELEIWATPSGVALQDLSWPNRSRTKHFFEAYLRGAMHAALFGRLAGAELLCLGGDMGEVLRTRPREEEVQDADRMALLELRSRSWKHLIRSVRQVFDGALTLAVPGPRSVEHTDVWGSLDVVGINLFLGKRTLEQSGGGAPSTIQRYWSGGLEAASQASSGRPHILWSVGLHSKVRAGQGHSLAGNAGQLAQDQRVWQAFAKALEERGDTGLKGYFLHGLGLDRNEPGDLLLGFEEALGAGFGED